MTLLLAHAQPEDRAALLDLWVEAWTAAMPDSDFEGRRAWFSGRLDELHTEGALTRLCRDDAGDIAGFVTLDCARRYLDQLAIRPALQGSGLATTLMVEAKRLCPDGLDLHVNQNNFRAVRFYEREGFAKLSAGVNPRSSLPIWQMRWPGEAQASMTKSLA